MTRDEIDRRKLDHGFGQDVKRVGESRTFIVIALTATMMVVEIVAGRLFGSMALLADGLHMASHAAALSINAGAYDRSFSFGTGKVNSLGGFTGAVLLGIFALVMVWESMGRFMDPVAIAFNEAISVAVIGLLVNGASVLILGRGHGNHHHDDLGGTGHSGTARAHHADHNLRAAYLHVLADAFTSLLAIFALLVAKWYGAVWMDPAMGVVGAVLVGRWSLGLIRTTTLVLLDREAPAEIRDSVIRCVEEDGDARVVDLHVWAIAPGKFAAIVSLVARQPHSPTAYKALISASSRLAHVTVEVNQRAYLDDGKKREAPPAGQASSS